MFFPLQLLENFVVKPSEPDTFRGALLLFKTSTRFFPDHPLSHLNPPRGFGGDSVGRIAPCSLATALGQAQRRMDMAAGWGAPSDP